ncbi:ImmA/IrrE family metallo-endopeptidase [Ramlibacter tataouinensis]|uniref:ImmA/IrrE family metallo-endopeptidase n=1 Tax=Ramlibacter tataouinensis TaxID=94132 RepID=UPI0022F39A0E|nr:ImmA/IrrE family metallo-endopeptidase [Ramlibacter tataouinensis]WBY00524.1 ImmA/IrrE family metallo-endopeptidase [Ramlibacter tataouinensis]
MLPRSTVMAVRKLAARVLNDYQVKQFIEETGRTRVDPIELAEKAGVFVMLQPLQSLLGAFLREERAGIILNSERPAGLIHMTCAHELGHYFLNHSTTADERVDYGDGGSRQEQEAEEFAYALLTPGWLLASVVNRRGWGRTLNEPAVLYQLSLRLGLSYEATIWSLLRSKHLSPDQARALAKIQPAAVKRRIAPPDFQPQPGRDVWLLTEADAGSWIEPRPGDAVFLDLPSRISAGFTWSLVGESGQEYALKPVPARLPPKPDSPLDIVVGAPARINYQVEFAVAAERRSAPLKLAQKQPWNPATPTIWELSLTTGPERIEKGLSDGSKEMQISEARE